MKRLPLGKGFVALCLFVFLWGICLPLQAQAKETETDVDAYIRQQIENYDMEEIERGFSELFPGYQIDTQELFFLILNGQILTACSTLFDGLKEGLLGELSGMKEIMISILVIGIVSSLFSNFSDIFAGRQVSQVGFYFLYLFLMAILTKAFVFGAEEAVGTMENIVLFVKLFIPTWFLSVGAAAGSATAVFYYQVMLLCAYLVESFLLAVLVPFIYSYVIMALLNGIWAEERLSLLLEFMKKGIEFALKIAMGAITGLSLVQSVIVPVIDGLKISALRKAVSAIPGIGGVAEGVTELVIGSAVLIKNSMGILLLVLLFGICLIPLFKILAITGLVKLGAALTGIVSDKRISGCSDKVGEGCFLLFRCLFTATALFLIVVGVVAYTVR